MCRWAAHEPGGVELDGDEPDRDESIGVEMNRVGLTPEHQDALTHDAMT